LQDFQDYFSSRKNLVNTATKFVCEAGSTQEEFAGCFQYGWQQIAKFEILRPYIKTLEGHYYSLT